MDIKKMINEARKLKISPITHDSVHFKDAEAFEVRHNISLIREKALFPDDKEMVERYGFLHYPNEKIRLIKLYVGDVLVCSRYFSNDDPEIVQVSPYGYLPWHLTSLTILNDDRTAYHVSVE